MTQTRQESLGRRSQIVNWTAAGLLAAIVLGTYWSAIVGLAERWYIDPDYIHGFLVPVFSAILLWHRRAMLKGVEFNCNLWGLPLMATAGVLRLGCAYFYYDSLDTISLLPCLAGLALFIGGWSTLRWAWPSIVFLIFMIPLPGFMANLLGGPLQRLATIGSTYMIQTLGISAVAEGNVISLSDSTIGVAEACNGLRNMMLFLTVCVGVSFVIQRTVIEKVIIVVSSAGIALVANLIRITVTAVLHETAGHHAATTLYHDLAGFFMMPLAALLLWLELAYLSHVFVPRTSNDL